MLANSSKLEGIAQTLFIPLFFRSCETERPDALFRDDLAVKLVQDSVYDFSNLTGHDLLQATIVLRVHAIDRLIQRYLPPGAAGTVVNLGSGLDTRFQRLNNSQSTWYEVDLPQVTALRHTLMDESERHRFIGASILKKDWLEKIDVHAEEPIIIVAEGLLPYFTAAQVRTLVVELKRRFAGAILIFDTIAPWQTIMSHFHPALMFGRIPPFRWGLTDAAVVEQWAEGIALLAQVYYLNQAAHRLGMYTWFRFLPPIGCGFSIVAYRLGNNPLLKG